MADSDGFNCRAAGTKGVVLSFSEAEEKISFNNQFVSVLCDTVSSEYFPRVVTLETVTPWLQGFMKIYGGFGTYKICFQT